MDGSTKGRTREIRVKPKTKKHFEGLIQFFFRFFRSTISWGFPFSGGDNVLISAAEETKNYAKGSLAKRVNECGITNPYAL